MSSVSSVVNLLCYFPECPIMRILVMCLLAAKPRVIDGFVDYLKIEKGLAPLTVAAYTTDIGQFAFFLEKHKRTLLNAQRKHVREFIQQLFGNSVDGRSVGRKLSALRHFIATCCSTRWLNTIPR